MEYEKLNDSEKECVLVSMHTSEIYSYYLAACHACANAAIKGMLTEEKAIRRFLPVVRLAIEWECGENVKYYDVLPLASRKFVNYRHIHMPGLWTFAPGKRAKFVRRWINL